MAMATFDTLKFANTLKAAGVPDKQAEAQAVAFAEVIQLNLKDLVTKDDLAATSKDMRHEMKEIEQRLAAKIDGVVTELKAENVSVRADMRILRWMIGATASGVVILIGMLARLLFSRGGI